MEESQHKISKVPIDHSLENHPNGVQVLKYKTFKPTIRKEFVKRQSLIDCLEANISYPMTLISAATGCGKSVTVSQWLEETNHKYGWLSVDDEHNDIQIFLTYLLTLLKEQWPQKTFGLEYILEGSNLSSNLIASTLLNDLDQLEDLFVLVMDDYDVIREEKIHEIINGIIRYSPAHFHLVILTQRDPPLKLAKLRAQFQLNEVRMKDLAFTADEAIKLRSLIASEIPDDQVTNLVKQSDGWITGITVGLMGLARGIEFGKVIQSLNSQNSIISELLDEEVINGLPIDTLKYLEVTTLLDRFSTELISTMVVSMNDSDLSQSGSEEFIRLSKRRNLFLVPLDSVGQWFRYHHVFRSQIQNRKVKYLNEEQVSLLYKSASRWLENQQLLEEALNYAIRSNDMAFAVNLFARHRIELHNTEQIQRLNRLIDLFPSEARDNHPEVLLSLAMLQDYYANYAGMEDYLSRAEELLKANDPPNPNVKKLLGEFHSVKDILFFKLGDLDQCIVHSEKAMELIPANEPYFYRESSVAYFSMAHQSIGKVDKGLKQLDVEFQTLAATDQYFKRRLLQGRCAIHLLEGSTAFMASDGAALISITSPKAFPAAWMMAVYSVTCSSYLNNHLDKVARFGKDLKQYRYNGWPFWVMHIFFIKCLSDMARGMWQEVDLCIGECEELADYLAIEPLKGMVQAFKVESYLRRDDIESAIAVSPLANFSPHPPFLFYYIPQLTQVKLLIKTNQLEKGRELLDNLLVMGRQRHNKMLLVQALALQAVVHANESNHEQAKNAVSEALLLSKDQKNIRAFLDHGDAIHHLLREMADTEPKNKQLTEIILALDGVDRPSPTKKLTVKGSKEMQVNALSDRELEILYLVTQGFKNNEIAEKLFVSLDTVKKHLYRAYQKLDVNNRVSAIKKVQELGLVTAG